jgi:hypothetical protein
VIARCCSSMTGDHQIWEERNSRASTGQALVGRWRAGTGKLCGGWPGRSRAASEFDGPVLAGKVEGDCDSFNRPSPSHLLPPKGGIAELGRHPASHQRDAAGKVGGGFEYESRSEPVAGPGRSRAESLETGSQVAVGREGGGRVRARTASADSPLGRSEAGCGKVALTHPGRLRAEFGKVQGAAREGRGRRSRSESAP